MFLGSYDFELWTVKKEGFNALLVLGDFISE